MTYYKRKYEDLGRYEITKDLDDMGRFRTPSLTDPILRPLKLTDDEKAAGVAFLGAITATQYHMQRPELPRQ